jgi:hypothetical protein
MWLLLDASEERTTSAIKVEGISELETSVLTRTTQRHIPEHSTLHNHHHENIISYVHFNVLLQLTLKPKNPYTRELSVDFYGF